MTAVLRRRTLGSRPCMLPMAPARPAVGNHWGRFGTNPLKTKLVKTLIPQVRTYLQEQVPEYMVPSAFVILEMLPLTPNGKVDRRALPAPEGTRALLETSYVASQTPVEQTLAAIWQEVLGIEQIGIHDNFFDLGGHSLLATQVVSRMRDQLQLEVPLRDFFAGPTIATLAEHIENVRWTNDNGEEFSDLEDSEKMVL